jgi:hypothetical protein
VDVASISDVPEIDDVSIFRVKMFRMGAFLFVTRYMFEEAAS